MYNNIQPGNVIRLYHLSMKYLVFILFLATLCSCKSQKAHDFNTLLDSAERKVFRILVADSMESSRLKALIAKKPALALSIGQKQHLELSKVIKEIDRTDVGDLQDGKPLKEASIKYYEALLKLKDIDILEAQLMAITLQGDTARAKKAQTDISNLAYKRLELHKVISTNDQANYQAKSKFEKINSIR